MLENRSDQSGGMNHNSTTVQSTQLVQDPKIAVIDYYDPNQPSIYSNLNNGDRA